MILLNGPPAVGKSALARRYVDEHPLTLHVEIDALRVSLGGWESHEDSKLIARDLAVALAGAHLSAGHDVVVPQFLGRVEFIETLDQLARRVGATFVEVLLQDTDVELAGRFRARRARLTANGERHPEGDVADAAVSGVITEALASLERVLAMRPRTQVIAVSDDFDHAYGELCRVSAP